MNGRELFLNDTNKISIMIGGAGNGGSYTGLLKLGKFIEQGKRCAVVMRNRKDIHVAGGIYYEAFKMYHDEDMVIVERTEGELGWLFPNGAIVKFAIPEDIILDRFDCMFVDNASQLDEIYQLDYFTSRADYVWFSSKSSKTRGFIFKQAEPYLVDHGEYYKFVHPETFKDVTIYHATCHDNKEFILRYPEYVQNLLNLSRKDQWKLYYGYFIK